MNTDRTAVCFGMPETGRTSLRCVPARLAALSAVFSLRAFTGSECRSSANQALGASINKRNYQRMRRRRPWPVIAIAVFTVLLPLATIAGSKPYVWPGRERIWVRDYTSSTFDGIVQEEVARWSAIMPGSTELWYSREKPTDCSLIGSLSKNIVSVGEIWICSTHSVGGKDDWGYGFAYTLDRLIVRGYAEIEEGGPKTEFERYGIVCHELGHTLGLRHMKGGGTCMTADRVKREFPGTKDAAALAKRYRAAGSP